MWIEWLKDEMNLKSVDEGNESKGQIIDLSEQALSDYNYRKVYKLYLKYLISLQSSDFAITENHVKIFERALKIWGLDLEKGDAMWQLYADYC